MKKPIPIGVDFFRELKQKNYYYVDKTRFIAEFLGLMNKVTLITRPRRFGKTLNLDTVREFLDISLDSKAIFAGLEIMDTHFAGEINSRPVLFFSFKDCKGDREELQLAIKLALRKEYQTYYFLKDTLTEMEKALFEELVRILVKPDEGIKQIGNAIQFLTEIVSKHYKKPVILLIDEYDTPMTAAYEAGCYQEFRSFFGSLYGSSLKGNRYLDQALITGIQRIAKENIFSDLNNLTVCDATSSQYSDCFGFTEDEVRTLLEYYELPFTDEVRLMYDGYRFGNSHIYNPWSIINYAQNNKLVAYWVNTSGSRLISQNIEKASHKFLASFDQLVVEGKTRVLVNLKGSTFDNLSDSSLWGLLVNAGYLTFAEEPEESPDTMQTLRFPNGDVRQDFKRIVAERTNLESGTLHDLFDALVNKKDVELFIKTYKDIILSATSYHDARENAYHMMLLGMCIYLQGRYEVKSNIEAGLGRSDIVLKSLRPSDMNVVIELKEGENTAALAKEALAQIKAKNYADGLKGDILLLGVAHNKKVCDVEFERM